MVEFITNVVMDCGQVKLGKSCGKFFNIMYDPDNCVRVQSFEKNDFYGFTNLNDLSDRMVEKIYNDMYKDFA